MTERELKRLSREDLLALLVSQSREVEQLREEKTILLSQLSNLRDEFHKAGMLDYAMGQLGFPMADAHAGNMAAAIDEVIARHQNAGDAV